jgi:hypothetical protein
MPMDPLLKRELSYWGKRSPGILLLVAFVAAIQSAVFIPDTRTLSSFAWSPLFHFLGMGALLFATPFVASLLITRASYQRDKRAAICNDIILSGSAPNFVRAKLLSIYIVSAIVLIAYELLRVVAYGSIILSKPHFQGRLGSLLPEILFTELLDLTSRIAILAVVPMIIFYVRVRFIDRLERAIATYALLAMFATIAALTDPAANPLLNMMKPTQTGTIAAWSDFAFAILIYAALHVLLLAFVVRRMYHYTRRNAERLYLT